MDDSSPDGFSYCGTRTYSISSGPAWLALEGSSLLVLNTDGDNEHLDEATITVTLDSDSSITASKTIWVELYKSAHGPDVSTEDREPDFIASSEGECLTNIQGTVLTNAEVNKWNVERQFYRLSKVKIWYSGIDTSGFEVTYSPPDDYTGWQELLNMFGNNDQGFPTEEIELDEDLQEI